VLMNNTHSLTHSILRNGTLNLYKAISQAALNGNIHNRQKQNQQKAHSAVFDAKMINNQ
jgi:hypothetical protein